MSQDESRQHCNTQKLNRGEGANQARLRKNRPKLSHMREHTENYPFFPPA